MHTVHLDAKYLEARVSHGYQQPVLHASLSHRGSGNMYMLLVHSANKPCVTTNRSRALLRSHHTFQNMTLFIYLVFQK